MSGDLHNAVLDAMKKLGFQLTGAPLAPLRNIQAMGCMQEFEFKPTPGSRFTHLDEAEIAFLRSAQRLLDVLIQRDTKARGLGSLLSELSGTDETFHRLTLQEKEGPEVVSNTLDNALD